MKENHKNQCKQRKDFIYEFMFPLFLEKPLSVKWLKEKVGELRHIALCTLLYFSGFFLWEQCSDKKIRAISINFRAMYSRTKWLCLEGTMMRLMENQRQPKYQLLPRFSTNDLQNETSPIVCKYKDQFTYLYMECLEHGMNVC